MRPVHDERDLFSYDADALSQIIPSLQNLHTLNLGARGYPQMSLRSSSLRVLDIRGAAKLFCLSHIDCPNLTEFHCNNGFYGNGVRRDGVLEYDFFDNNATSYDPLGRPSPLDAARILHLDNTIVRLSGDLSDNQQHYASNYYRETYNALTKAQKEKRDMLVWLSIPARNTSWARLTPNMRAPIDRRIDLPPACEVHFHTR